MDQSEIVAATDTPAVAPTAAAATEMPAAAPVAHVEPPAAAPAPPPLPTEPAAINVEHFKPAIVTEPPVAAKPGMRRTALLAASLTVAIALGALAGAAATVHFAPAAPAPVAQAPVPDHTLALKAAVAQLGRELATVKSSIDAVNRSTATQFKTIAERFDRADKAQAEPAAKLAKITETLERLERRAAAPAPTPAPTSTRAAPDVTGTVTSVDKQPAKPPTIEGWRVIDVYAGRAVLQSRAGALYEIGPGSNLPGVGRIEQIKRQDGRIVVVTPKGIITADIQQTQQRRQQYYGPYRY